MAWLHADLLQSANDEIIKAERESWEPEPELIPNIQVYHYHNDHLGTPNELTNQDGDVVWLADYEAWGNVAKVVWREEKLGQLKVSSDELQPLRFQGQFIDQETGLHYNRFRYYDPDLGMFISRDPIGLLGGNNVFQYAPNPIGWVDPFGLAKLEHAPDFDTARRKAFEYAGMTDPDKVSISKIDPITGTAVEFKGEGGAKVAYDSPHADMDATQGHDKPHVGWQTSGKRKGGGAERGNITYEGQQHPHRSNDTSDKCRT